MKNKRILTLAVIALIALSQLCSCQAPAKDPERESQWETQTPEAEKDYTSLQELIDEYLPVIEQTENPNWQQKLMDIDPHSQAFQQDKPAVCLSFSSFSDQTLTEFIAKQKQFDGKKTSSYGAELLLRMALAKKFKQEYIKESADFVSTPLDLYVVVYASATDLEYYASCNVVEAITLADDYDIPDGAAPSRYFGRNLVAWEKNGYTYYYRREAHIIQNPITPPQADSTVTVPVLNEERFDLKGVRPLKLQNIDSVETLSYLQKFDGSSKWLMLVSSYDESFFQTKTLFLITFTEGSGSISHTIKTIDVSDNTFYVVVEQFTPEVGTADMADWIILIEADRDKIADCTVFDAWMN